MRAYEQTTNGNVHLALTKGNWGKDEMILTRIQSSKITNDILGMLTGSLHERLDDIFKLKKEDLLKDPNDHSKNAPPAVETKLKSLTALIWFIRAIVSPPPATE